MKLAYAYHIESPHAGLSAFEAEHQRCTAMWDRLVDMDRELERELHDGIAAAVPEWRALDREEADIRAADWGGRKTEFRKRLREIRSERWTLEKAWRKANKDFVAGQTARRFEAIKLIRQESGCYWPNYNSVIARYEAGRQAATQTGRRMRHHDPLRDDAMLCVQIQRTSSGLGAAPEELPSLSMIGLGDRPDGQRPIVELRMRVTVDGDDIRAHALMHRPLPACRIKGAQVCRRRVGKSLVWKLVLQCADIERPAPIQYRREGSITFDWQRTESGGLLVASPSWREPYVLPADWMAALDRLEASISWLDSSLEEQIEAADDALKARLSGGLLAVRMLRQDDVPEAIRPWLRSWKLEYERWTHGRSKVLGRRRELYRLWAREIVRECPRLAIETRRLDKLARQERGTESNSLRQRACIHAFRAEIIHQANKLGALVLADDLASGDVLTLGHDQESGAWQRRKARKQERSQSVGEAVDPAVV